MSSPRFDGAAMSRPRAGRFSAAVVAVALIALAAFPAAAQASTAELTVSPAQLDFPTTTVGNPGGQQQVTAKNTGDVPVSINNVFIDGTNSSDFNQNGNCGGQLDPGQSVHHQRELLGGRRRQQGGEPARRLRRAEGRPDRRPDRHRCRP